MILTSEERGRLHKIFVEKQHEWFDVDPYSGCWLWKRAKTWAGYGAVRVRERMQRAHRASYAFHVGQIPEEKQVMHSCDVRNCVNPSHLSVGTNKDNVADKIAKGRGWSKLSGEQVRDIRRRYSELGVSQTKLGEEYGVSRKLVNQIIRHEIWVHLS